MDTKLCDGTVQSETFSDRYELTKKFEEKMDNPAVEMITVHKGSNMVNSIPPAKPPRYVPDEKTEREIDQWFTYHPPKGDQSERYVLLRTTAKLLALQIVCNVPSCADRTAALRKLRECIMTANAAIACNE